MPNDPRQPPRPRDDWALFLDVDGTLLDIAPRPDAAEVPDGLRESLAAAAAALGGALALVSGRAVADIDRLFAPLRLPASGQHGAELRAAAVSAPAAGVMLLPESALDAVGSAVAGMPGVHVEIKTYAAAVHYRAAPEAGEALRRSLVPVAAATGLALLPGRLVWELRPFGVSKGTAVGAFMAQAPFRGRRPVFIGDDIADEDGFAAARAQGGLGLRVAGYAGEDWPQPATPPSFTGPAAVRAWLADLARLQGSRTAACAT
ncbi:MAG: trehalose-phosphatase [Alphaproteobacteria bacterium]|nr:trehalose-phosphatase [Alphaproteobacteria bacterium]